MLIEELLSDGEVNELLVALGKKGLRMREHAERTAGIAFSIASEMKLGDSETRDVALGALLHEVGKLDVPDSILFKPGKLNEAEAGVMRTFPYLGYERVRGLPSLASAAEIVYAHRERFDGSGYQRGLKGEEIPLGARIVAVACAACTFIADRPHDVSRAMNYARSQVSRWSGSEFDPRIVEILAAVPRQKMPGRLSHVSSDIWH